MTKHPRLDIEIPAIAKKQQEIHPYRVRVSNSGACPRQLYYHATGAEARQHSGRMMLVFDDGSVHEDASVKWLELSNYSIHNRQLPLDIGIVSGISASTKSYCQTCEREIAACILHGHIDGTFEYDDETILFEHKAIGQPAFDALVKEYPVGYVLQCASYLRGLNNIDIPAKHAVLLLKNKNRAEYRQIWITYDFKTDTVVATRDWDDFSEDLEIKNATQKVIDLHRVVDEAVKAETPPKRPYDYEDWHCKFCQYQAVCWDGYDVEVSKMSKDVELENSDDIRPIVAEFSEKRKLKSSLDKEVKELRRKLKKVLTERGIKKATVSGVKFGIRVIRKSKLDEDLLPEKVKEKAKRITYIEYVDVGDEKENIDAV